ncbi:hypothetical protein [Pseudodesulfovibrio methanolicus]|uniref:Uncharacterized protein n=1 Tax=Pseudodesulfovibrio methanolicus TaxID=3126690 RepID=A0ABZ2IZF6_9BACT
MAISTTRWRRRNKFVLDITTKGVRTMDDAKVILEDGTEYPIVVGSFETKIPVTLRAIGPKGVKVSKPHVDIYFEPCEGEQSISRLRSMERAKMTVVANTNEYYFKNVSYVGKETTGSKMIFEGEKL